MTTKISVALLALALATAVAPAAAQTAPPETLFRNVRIFDGTNATLSASTSVLVHGNMIAAGGQ